MHGIRAAREFRTLLIGQVDLDDLLETTVTELTRHAEIETLVPVFTREVRGAREDPILVAAPSGTTTYDVEVRCSTLSSCADTETVVVQVDCPATGNLRRFSEVVSTGAGQFSWTPLVPGTDHNPEIPGEFQVHRGAVVDLPDYSTGSIAASGQTGTVWIDGSVPATSTYYLFARDGSRSGLGCNEIPFLWGSGGTGEAAGRDDDTTLPPP